MKNDVYDPSNSIWKLEGNKWISNVRPSNGQLVWAIDKKKQYWLAEFHCGSVWKFPFKVEEKQRFINKLSKWQDEIIDVIAWKAIDLSDLKDYPK